MWYQTAQLLHDDEATKMFRHIFRKNPHTTHDLLRKRHKLMDEQLDEPGVANETPVNDAPAPVDALPQINTPDDALPPNEPAWTKTPEGRNAIQFPDGDVLPISRETMRDPRLSLKDKQKLWETRPSINDSTAIREKDKAKQSEPIPSGQSDVNVNEIPFLPLPQQRQQTPPSNEPELPGFEQPSQEQEQEPGESEQENPESPIPSVRPPIHEHCHCEINTLPGGRQVWHTRGAACPQCAQARDEFNQVQDMLFPISDKTKNQTAPMRNILHKKLPIVQQMSHQMPLPKGILKSG